MGTTRIERLAEALRFEAASSDSAYGKVGGYAVRLAGHARQSHHSATSIYPAADVQVLVLDPSAAEDFAAWRREAPRQVRPAEVVVVKPRERTATMLREVRRAISHAIHQLRQEEREAEIRRNTPPTAEELAASTAYKAEAARRAPFEAQVPPLNTPGRKAIVLRIREEAIAAGLAPDEARRIG